MDNLLRVYNTHSNTYINFEAVRNIINELEYMEKTNHFFIDNVDEIQQVIYNFQQLYEYETEHERHYKNKKAENRQAVKLTCLLPKANLRINKLLKLRNSFLKVVLGKHYNLTLSYVERKGKARYLVMIIAEREFYSKEKAIAVKATRDMYRNRLTNTFCRSDDENAVLYAIKGAVLRVEKVQFSKTKFRVFNRPKEEWIPFLKQLHRLYINCLERINVTASHLYAYNKLDLKQAKNRYQQWKIYKYNKMISDMNLVLDDLFSFIYSPACYYQNYEVIKAFGELFYKYKARLNNKAFHKGKVSLKFNLDSYYKVFNENINSLYMMFVDDVNKLKKYIALNY